MKLFLRSTLLALVAFVVTFPLAALAQAVADPGPSFNDLIQQALGTVSTWRAAGWLAGSVALVNTAVNLLKFAPLDKFLSGLKIGWWLRPVLSLVLGIVAGVFSSMVGGQPVGLAILIALLSGLSSTGFHELMTTVNQRVQAERGVGAIVVNSVVNATDTESLKAKLAEIEKLPAEARLAALAVLGKKA